MPYDPRLLNNPEAMIAGFAQLLAHHLGLRAGVEPPGGMQNWPHVTEVIGVFLGFGLLFANTAYHAPRRSCGSSCGTPTAEREAYLSQYDISYALALFCELKDIPNSAVLPQLKRSLRGFFKQCRRDIAGRSEALQRLREQSRQNAERVPLAGTA
jgi:hypothetical protein